METNETFIYELSERMGLEPAKAGDFIVVPLPESEATEEKANNVYTVVRLIGEEVDGEVMKRRYECYL